MPMTEAEWVGSVNVGEMLSYLKQEVRVARSPKGRRKLRFFACGCCRQIWQLIEDERSRRIVEISEQRADGLADCRELAEAKAAAESAWSGYGADVASAGLSSMARIRGVGAAIGTALQTAAKESYEAARVASFGALCAVGAYWSIDWPSPAWDAQEINQSDMIRCIFGNPFRPSPPLPPAVLAWNDGTVRRIAEGIYHERRMPEGTLDKARLAILSDALLDAGCDDEQLMGHCRSDGPHLRGCWAIDLILGKS
jgi:hypothetical protein